MDQPDNAAREAPWAYRRLRRVSAVRSPAHFVRLTPERGGRRPVDIAGLLEELVAALETVLLHFSSIDRADFSFAAPRRGAAAYPCRGEARTVRPRVHGLSRGFGNSSGPTPVLDPYRAGLPLVGARVRIGQAHWRLQRPSLAAPRQQDVGVGPRSHHRCPNLWEPDFKRSSWTRQRSKPYVSSP